MNLLILRIVTMILGTVAMSIALMLWLNLMKSSGATGIGLIVGIVVPSFLYIIVCVYIGFKSIFKYLT